MTRIGADTHIVSHFTSIRAITNAVASVTTARIRNSK